MSKALRLPLGFILVLAGYNPTPADEMEGLDTSEQQPAPARREAPRPDARPQGEVVAELPEDAEAEQDNRKRLYAKFWIAWGQVIAKAGIDASTARFERLSGHAAVNKARGDKAPVESVTELTDEELWTFAENFVNYRGTKWVPWLVGWATANAVPNAEGKLDINQEVAP